MSDMQRQPSGGSADGLSSDFDGLEAIDLSSEGSAADLVDKLEVVGVSSEGSTGTSSDAALNPALQDLLDGGVLTVEALQVKNGEDIRQISLGDILNYFWTDGPDTPCMVCEGNFDDARGPPIRTFSIDLDDLPEAENLMLALSKLVVHVHNRHLECATRLGVHFITVSHVWHQEVAEAHYSKCSADEAVVLAWFVPIRILNSISGALRQEYPKLELWHDYLSVPQWNYTVQQQLLLYLPAIYKASALCLVHLDDISNSDLSIAFSETARARDVVESIAKFFNSHWFRRLWVALEYISSTQTCLMVESNRLITFRQSLDSFTPIMDFFTEMDRYLSIKERPGFYDEVKRRYPLYASSAKDIRRENPDDRVLGEGYNLVSRVECRTYRDRFIALVGLLNLGNYMENARQIPEDTTAACHWVSMKCLERGDFTPLLLTHTGETDVPYARWLRGHESIHRFMWTGGRINNQPENPRIINTGRIEPELEYVGTIEEVCYVGFELRWTLSSFQFVVSFLFRQENNIFSAADLVNTLLRIYAVPPYISKGYPDIPNSFEEYCDRNPNFKDEIMAIIVIYLKLVPQTEPPDRHPICELLANKLLFLRPYTSNLNNYSRLSYAASHADAKFYDDMIARVRCGDCDHPFVFRLAFYKGYKIWQDQKLYRIPGLGCVGFPGNGIGLIMVGALIRGRTMFATPACACRIRHKVVIE